MGFLIQKEMFPRLIHIIPYEVQKLTPPLWGETKPGPLVQPLLLLLLGPFGAILLQFSQQVCELAGVTGINADFAQQVIQ